MLADQKTVPPLNDADVESILNPTPSEEKIDLPTPHPSPYVQLNHNRDNFNPNSSRPLFTHSLASNSEQNHTYRILPIIAGILIPFLVLLSIPSLTSHWYTQTHAKNVTVTLHTRPSPPLLVVAMGLSMACGVLANICLVLRFAERSVKKMTLLCIILLSMHGSCLTPRLQSLLRDIMNF